MATTEYTIEEAYANYKSHFPNTISNSPEITLGEFENLCNTDDVFYSRWKLKPLK